MQKQTPRRLEQINLEHILTLEVFSAEEKLKSNFLLLWNKLNQLATSVEKAQASFSDLVQLKRTVERQDRFSKQLDSKINQLPTKQDVERIAALKISQMFGCQEQLNLYSSVIISSQIQQASTQNLTRCSELINTEIGRLNIAKILNHKEKSKLGGEAFLLQEADLEDYYETLRGNLMKSSELFSQTKVQLGKVDMRLQKIEQYLSNKHLQNLIGKKIIADDMAPGVAVIEKLQKKVANKLNKRQSKQHQIKESQKNISPSKGHKESQTKQDPAYKQKVTLTAPKQRNQVMQTNYNRVIKFSKTKEGQLQQSAKVRVLLQTQKQGRKTQRKAPDDHPNIWQKRELSVPKIDKVNGQVKAGKRFSSHKFRPDFDQPGTGSLYMKLSIDQLSQRHYDFRFNYNALLKELDLELQSKVGRNSFLAFVDSFRQRLDRQELDLQNYQRLVSKLGLRIDVMSPVKKEPIAIPSPKLALICLSCQQLTQGRKTLYQA